MSAAPQLTAVDRGGRAGRLVPAGVPEAPWRDWMPRWESIGGTLFVILIAFLAFVAGAMVVLGKQFPYPFLREAHLAGGALLAQRRQSIDRFATDLWREARSDDRGVVVHDPARVFSGYTLYTSGDAAAARLVAMDGRLVHEWRLPFSAVWNDDASVASPQPDHLIYMAKARLLPDGEILAIYEAAGDTPWGYGMVKLDRHSRPVWSYLAHAHHDFDVAPDGRILLLTHEFVFDTPAHFRELEPPRLDDFIVVLSPQGRELMKLSLSEAMMRSRYEPYFRSMPHFSLGDPLHTNTIEYIDAAKAAGFAFGNEGDVLLSFRDLGLIAVVTPETGEVAWATRGPWLGQHDTSLLANGNILLFDNRGAFREGNRSRLLEVDPVTSAITWVFQGEDGRIFDSPLRASAERLPNGNTLTTESDGGRLLEVTRDGEIVWEYVNPVRGGDGDRFIPIVNWAQRIDPASLDPQFRRLLESRMEVSR